MDDGSLAEEYYLRIDKPMGSRRAPLFWILPVGVMRAGKTTVLKKILQELPAVRVSVDEIRLLLSERGVDMAHAESVARTVIARLIKEGYSIAFDTDMVRKEKRDQLLSINDGQYRVLWIRVTAPERVLMARKSAWPWFELDPERLRKVHHNRVAVHAEEGDIEKVPYTYVFDTSKPNLDNQVKEFLDLARKTLQ